MPTPSAPRPPPPCPSTQLARPASTTPAMAWHLDPTAGALAPGPSEARRRLCTGCTPTADHAARESLEARGEGSEHEQREKELRLPENPRGWRAARGAAGTKTRRLCWMLDEVRAAPQERRRRWIGAGAGLRALGVDAKFHIMPCPTGRQLVNISTKCCKGCRAIKSARDQNLCRIKSVIIR